MFLGNAQQGSSRSGGRAGLAGEGGAQRGRAGAGLCSHGPAETASVATANDEYHMLGSCCYKISYVTAASE